MTIRLTDVEAQKRYERDLEEYREAIDKRMGQPSAPSGWPSPPKEPGPMVNSHDEESPSNNPFGLSMAEPMPSFGRDPRFPGAVQSPQDGNAHADPKGYESNWTASNKAPAKPFTLKK